MPDFAAWSRALQARMESTLERAIPAHVAPERLHEAMRYVCLGGGKRVRPMLVFAAAEAVNGNLACAEAAACAVELIHVYSLTHDDLPCMDNDDLRRGKPTCHVSYDEATALLVGDALQALAFEQLARKGLHDEAATQIEMLHLLAHASGSRGMAGGQATDLSSTGQQLDLAELEFMHIHKTGALIRASTLLGGLCGSPLTATQRSALERYSHCVGLAFQVMDDYLDAEADTATLGKTAGKDAACGKATYLTLMPATEARAYAHALIEEACAAVSLFGDRAKRLVEIAHFVVTRAY